MRAAARRVGRMAARLACLAFALAFALPLVRAGAAGKTVRVGWFESPFNSTDSFGRRSGYAYEYQRKIAAYTGWTYEYVEGTWSELMKKLRDGEIDLMSDVSYMEDRADHMLYSSLPMGAEAYYVFVRRGNTDISTDSIASLGGKRVGVTQDSIQQSMFLDWAWKHEIRVDLVELSCAEDESLEMVADGRLDAFITLDSYDDPGNIVPVFKVGASDFYFAVNKSRPDLLAELDAAMNRIADENRYYNEQLHEKYLRRDGINMYLSAEEADWLEGHGPIRVGYQDNYLAFCASDAGTGQITGALKEYLDYASAAMGDAHLAFEAIAYPTAAAAVEALQRGEVDCMFPANLTDYDSEMLGVMMSPPLMLTEMDAVVRAADQQSFVHQEDVTVAVNEGNPNYDMFLVDHFPGWKTIHCVDTPACLEEVAAGRADCIIISNYRFNNISKLCQKLRLTTVSTGVDMDYCFAVREGDTTLYSILARVTGVVPTSTVNAALTYYSTEDAKMTFGDFVRNNLAVVTAGTTAIALVFLVLLLREIRAERKVNEEAHLVDALNKRVFVDALTSVRNKGAFTNYIQGLQERLDGGEALEFAIGVFDCDDLKTVNDHYGHDKGDEYLKAATRLICRTFQHSPVFRIGGDEFAVVLQGEDFENRDELIYRFEKTGEEISAAAENRWDRVHVAMGVAEYDPGTDRMVIDTARRADKIMYENKRAGKRRQGGARTG